MPYTKFSVSRSFVNFFQGQAHLDLAIVES